MKLSRVSFIKIVFCAAFGILISSSAVFAESAATTAAVNALNASMEGQDLATITELGQDAIQASESSGGGEETTQAIIDAVVQKAIDLGAAQNQIDTIIALLVDASRLENAQELGDNARQAGRGPTSSDATKQKSSVGGDNPVPTGTPAGGEKTPEGCSAGDFACIATTLGITVDQARARFGG